MAAATSKPAWLKSARAFWRATFCASAGFALGRRLDLELGQDEVPPDRAAGPFLRELVVGEDLEADRGDPLQLGLGGDRVDPLALLARGDDRAIGQPGQRGAVAGA